MIEYETRPPEPAFVQVKRRTRQPDPPDRLPRFSILGLMMLTVAIAIVLGTLQASPRFAPLVSVLLLAGWATLLAMRPEDKATVLVCKLWSGAALPATLIGVAVNDSHFKRPLEFAMAYVGIWIAPYLIWSIVRYFRLPRTAALLSGCLGVTSLNCFLSSISFGFFGASGVENAFGKEPLTTLVAMIAIIGIITAGFTAAAFHILAMRDAWRRSYRNLMAAALVALGPFLMVVCWAAAIN